jgi:thiol-disulfide isomerase/thioredoxin
LNKSQAIVKIGLTFQYQSMKPNFLLVLSFLLPLLSSGEDSCIHVSLKIEIDSKHSGIVLIGREFNYKFEFDTIPFRGQPVYFKDCLSEPRQLDITYRREKGAEFSFTVFIEPVPNQIITISNRKDSLYYSMSGSKTQEEYKLVTTFQDQIMKKYNDPDSLIPFERAFIKANPDSYISGLLLALQAARTNADTLGYYLSMLTPKARKYKYASHAEQIMLRKKENSVGAPMRLFAATDNHGQPFSSMMLDAKPILLEFWASWCEPCRKSFPELQKIIRQYQPLGLEVVGISEDMHTDAWLKAIATDSLQNWHHILSGLKEDVEAKGQQKRISYQFGVTVFPTRLLVDANGIIIGRWEGETEMNTFELKTMLQKTFRD